MVTSKQKENMPNEHLHELLVDGLRDILWAEKHLIKGLKKMTDTAKSDTLKKAFDMHRQQTENHVEKLKEVFATIQVRARGKTCRAMKGLLEEADEIAEEFMDSPEVLDAALIAAAQKVEHYEIASYGCLVTYAKLMGHNEAKELLGQILAEEKEADELLTEIAMGESNLSEEDKNQ